MPVLVANAIEKSVISVPQAPVVIGANKAVDVLPDITADTGFYIGRYIQNVGAGIAYYALGMDCSPAQYNGVLAAAGAVDANGIGSGQQFDASNTPQRISVYSKAGTTIAITLLKRNDPMLSGCNIVNSII